MPKAKRQRSIVDAKHTFQKLKKQRTDRATTKSRAGSTVNRKTSHATASNTQQQGPKPWVCISVIDKQAASAVDRLIVAAVTHKHGATIKSLTLAPHIENKKATYAVTCETLKHLDLLQNLESSVALLQQHPRLTKGTAYVLIYEALLGKGLKAQGPAERPVVACIPQLKQLLQKALDDAGAQSVAQYVQQHVKGERQESKQTAPIQHERFVRVNTLMASVDEALQKLRNLSPELAASCKRDDLLPDLLVLPAGTPLHDHPLVADGTLVLQSKASCLPAHALSPQPGWQVVDCCAAPGNKTTHLAALMQNRGKIFAFDRDAKRIKRLQANAAQRGASCISATCADFLSIDPTDAQYERVRGVLLDPSCSGSGTFVSRMDHLLPAGQQEQQQQQEEQRVESLARFQEACLRHALRFPALQRLAYSTCSVHQRENEDVVAAVLPEAQAMGFELKDPFPAWHRRGLPLYAGCEKLVRVDPMADGTEGFFVAVFERRGAGEQQGMEQKGDQGGEVQQQVPAVGKQKGKRQKHK